MFQPPIRKYFKCQKGKNKGNSSNGNFLSFGDYGLKSISRGRLTFNQIESGRKVISKYIKKLGKLWIRVYPDKPITKKPIELRMGNGKGDVKFYVFEIKPGKIIYELNGISEDLARKIFKLASFKLPLKTNFCNF